MFVAACAYLDNATVVFRAAHAAEQGSEKRVTTRGVEPVAAATLADLAAGKLTLVDLTYPLNKTTNYWPGERYSPFELTTIATLERDGALSKAFKMPEHMGTHIDAPNHFESDQPAVDQIKPADLFAAGVVIDARAQCEKDGDYRLTRDDIEAWERRHGKIPQRAVVALLTGWGKHWDEPARFNGKDERGRLHFPGYSAEAAQFLVKERNVRGLAIDTLSIDYGLSQNFIVHHIVNRAGRYGLENVANLDRLPPRGFYLLIAPIKIESGSGGPTRVIAIVP
jgi:kynurenine formamidase